MFRILGLLCLALVNYLDEVLTTKMSSAEEPDIHKRVGGLLVASTCFSVIGLAALFPFINDLSTLESGARWAALLSAIPAVATFVGYMYSLNKFSVHLIAPLFLLTTVWLVAFELTKGRALSSSALVAMALILLGSYLLDIGELAFRIPTKLVLFMIPTTLAWATSNLLIDEALREMNSATAFFLQLVGIQIIGFLIVIAVPPYRKGFAQRVIQDGKVFVGISLANESLAQLSFLFLTLSIASAPFISYVAALEGLQSLFVLSLLFVFPISERSNINRIQVLAIVLTVTGAFALAIS